MRCPALVAALSLVAPALVRAVPSEWPVQVARSSPPGSSSSSPAPSSPSLPGPSVFTAPYAFPTQAFSSYYNDPASPSTLPQPIIPRPDGIGVFPLNLTDPYTLPNLPPADEVVYPPATIQSHLSTDEITRQAVQNASAIVNGTRPSCDKCAAALELAQTVARIRPQAVPEALRQLCVKYKYASEASCNTTYTPSVMGSIVTQVLAFADLAYSNASAPSLDAQYICSLQFSKACPLPSTTQWSKEFLHSWFPQPKPSRNASVASPPRSRAFKSDRLRVLHLSDFHVDARYLIGSESNGSSSQGCRLDAFNPQFASGPPTISELAVSSAASNSSPPVLHGNISVPAGRFGEFKCDSPYSLVLSALQAIPVLLGGEVGNSKLDAVVLTGDITTHDADNHISRDLVEYSETAIYTLLRQYLGEGIPVWVALGNHDSAPSDQNAPHSLPLSNPRTPSYSTRDYNPAHTHYRRASHDPTKIEARADVDPNFSWEYDTVAKLWEGLGWIDGKTANEARTHYGGYAVVNNKWRGKGKLKTIALNGDFWYRSNYFNYINTSNPDVSGQLRFLTDELQDAEDRGLKVWIISHVLTGWDGSNPLFNPTDLYYQIVDRYSDTIANIFYGHTHEDFFNIFYANNATNQTKETAQNVAWVGPSITPGSNLNPGFRLYEVDPTTFDIMDAYHYYSNLSQYDSLTPSSHGPVFEFEYSSRDAYGKFNNGTNTWPIDAPLNATFWHLVTEEMEQNPSLVQTFTEYEGKLSIKAPPCQTDECVKAKICYMRSGSAPIGSECKQGYGSVQSAYKP